MQLNAAEAWVHAKKVRPVWAKQVRRKQAVETLEGIEQMRVGDFICRGEAGEFWPQSSASFREKYEATKIVDDEGFELYLPRRSAQGVMAAKVNHAFVVHTRRGELKGKTGDYLVKNYKDTDVGYPQSVWIVDGKLFRVTYRLV